MNGLLLVDKETGCTSRDCVNKIIKKFNTKRVGHTGTLDPLATGVLVIAVGKATKLVNYLTAKDKEYIASIKLGTLTDTLDIDGNVLKEVDVFKTDEEIKSAVSSMKGTYEQEVPIYSACKINGKKLYEYARENIEVELPKRDVNIDNIEIISDIIRKDNKIYFDIKCKVSKGTYIRSLINDIAHKLDTVGIMCDLRRIKQGKFDINNTKKIDDIELSDLISVYDTIDDVYKVVVNDILKKDILNGKIIKDIYNKERVAFVTDDNKVLAIYKKYEKDNDYLKPDIMLGGI